MDYTDLHGHAVTGDVWSPGPLPATVWVLTPGGGDAVVHVTKRAEVSWRDRWAGPGVCSSHGPTLSPKLWREALGFDPRAVARGEAEQPALVACPVAVEPEPEPVAAEVCAEPEPEPVAEVVAEPELVACEVAAEPELVACAALPLGTAVRLPVDATGRDGVVIGAAREDGRVKARCLDEHGSVWLIDPARLVILWAGPVPEPVELVAEPVPVAEPAPEPVAVREPEPTARIDYRKPAAASRKPRTDRKPVAEAPELVAEVAAEPEPVAARIDYRKPAARIDYRKPVAQRCSDPRCTDGLTRCQGCNGYGVTTAGGKRYRLAGGGRNIGASAVRHEACGGTGLAVCGCRAELVSPVAVPAPA